METFECRPGQSMTFDWEFKVAKLILTHHCKNRSRVKADIIATEI